MFAKTVVLLNGLFVMTLSGQERVSDNPFYTADTVTVVAEREMVLAQLSVMTSKVPRPIRLTPASVSAVTRPVLEIQNAVVLSDALRNVSGVNVESGLGIHDYFLIRGFDSLSSGLLLIDGASEPEVSFYHLYNVDRVDVLKGPGAFLYGGNPLSGTVNLTRKRPVFRNFLKASGSYGRFRTYEGSFDGGFAIPNSNLAFRMNGLFRQSNNFRDLKGNRTSAINPAVTWRWNQRGQVTASVEFVTSEFQPDAGLPLQVVLSGDEPEVHIPDVPRTNSYQSPHDRSEQEIYRVRLDLSQQISGALTIRNKFYLTRLDWQSNGTVLEGIQRTRRGDFRVSRRLQFLDDDQKFVGNQLEALFSFQTGSFKHSAVAGFEAIRMKDDFRFLLTSLEPVDLIKPVEPFVLDEQLLLKIPIAAADARTWVFAPYVVNQTTVSEHLELVVGARFDLINYDDRRRDVLGFGQLGIPVYQDANTERNLGRLSPMLGVVVAPTENWAVYANSSQAFAPPSTLVSGDPKPEQSRQFEFGTKTSFLDGKLTANLAIFHLRKENITIPDASGFLAAVGDQRSVGVELETQAELRQAWFGFLSYAYTDAELTEFREVTQTLQGFDVLDRSGNTSPFAPKHILNFWSTKEYENGVGIGFGFRYVSHQFIDENNAFELDDYLIFNATMFYRIRNFKWQLNFKNLTDHDFERRGLGATSVTPADPFAIYGRVEVSL